MALPRGWWRPYLLYSGIAFSFVVLLKGVEPGVAALLTLLSSPLVLMIALRSALPPSSFVRGLRERGTPVEVVSDEVLWFGERRMVVRAPEGLWRLECWSGKTVRLLVRGPGMRRKEEVCGSPRHAGRAAADGSL